MVKASFGLSASVVSPIMLSPEMAYLPILVPELP